MGAQSDVAKLIKPLPRGQFEPYFEKMLPDFRAPYKWAMSDDGKELLGMAQRFGPYSLSLIHISEPTRPY